MSDLTSSIILFALFLVLGVSLFFTVHFVYSYLKGRKSEEVVVAGSKTIIFIFLGSVLTVVFGFYVFYLSLSS